MKILRIILFPVVPIYYIVTWLRNWLYDIGFFKSKSYDFPLICVGNLSTGGTGKSPHAEYLVRLLKDKLKVATLSRGYKRKTKGFFIANDSSNATTVGDEPFQFYSKFKKDCIVAVDEDRQNGIESLLKLEDKPEVIVLDDAFQHRKVKAGLTILLTTYSDLYVNDWVLPTGNLREPKSGAKRASIIIVSKCPETIKEEEQKNIKRQLKPRINQTVLFSKICYSDTIISDKESIILKDLNDFTLVTGIANSNQLVNFLNSIKLNFNHLEFNDHYNYTEKDIELLNSKSKILTTEKDYMRLKTNKQLNLKTIYYLPITIKLNDAELFNNLVLDFIEPK